MLRLALYQPDIPQNLGTMMRLCACLDVAMDVIEPCGFVWDDAKIRRAGMDYINHLSLSRHSSWESFQALPRKGRLLLLTTKGAQSYTDYKFEPGDTVMMGRESAGVPEAVHAAVDARLLIPMHTGFRSINVATAAAMVLGEALRQLRG